MYSLDSFPVLELDLSIPQNGAFCADVLCSTDSGSGTGLQAASPPSLGQRMTLTVDSFTFNGAVASVDLRAANRATVRLIGGAGGFPNNATAKSYGNGPLLKNVVLDMLSSAGETLSVALSDASTLNLGLPSWQLLSDRSWGQNLSRLAKEAGATWRVDLGSGQAYFAVDTFSSSATMPTNPTFDSAAFSGQGTYECPLLDALPLPGTNDPTGNPIREVVVLLHSNKLQFQLKQVQGASYLPQQLDIDFTRTYPCTVVGANSDSTGYTLLPDDASIAGAGSGGQIQGVPVRGGTSTTWNLIPGARVLVSFDNADPSLPSIVAMDGIQSGDRLNSVSFGNASAAQFLAQAPTVDSNFNAILAAAKLGLASSSPQDKAAWTAFVNALQFSATACTKVKSA